MAQSTVDLVRTIINLIEDKKDRTLLKKEIAKHDASRESAENAVAELREAQADLQNMHQSIEAVEEAQRIYADAVRETRQMKENAEISIVSARNNVQDMYDQHDAWYADVQAREVEIGAREAALKQDSTTVETELHKKEVLISQREVGVSKREEVAAKLIDEYKEKLAVLKKNVKELA